MVTTLKLLTCRRRP
uniref:Uncharacterized protein n=1 Tax=Anguilla anguilla TaxID=7936 RepID=A0A0E9VE74_ANGAN